MASQAILDAVQAAAADGKITETAATHIREWLTEPKYADYADQVAEHVTSEKWQALDDAFWTIIPFGTGGRRGRMYPIGSNAINDRTIGESAQGLANYVKATLGEGAELSCAIARDTRHRSEDFARLCAEIMVAAGFKVYFLSSYRSTPELSYAVRYKNCSCGIMVTASHNPPSDNAVKVYWSSGAQVLPPHDKGIIDRVMTTDKIERADFDKAEAEGKIVRCEEEVDKAFIEAVVQQGTAGPRELKVLYSPLHGVGTTCVVPALEKDGFTDVEVFALHAEPSGDFPNVPGHVSNPENPEVFDAIIGHAMNIGADVCLATDPDCDRIGLAAPLTLESGSDWRTLTGNQIGALLSYYVCETRNPTSQNFQVTTLVTTKLIERIGISYGIHTYSDLLVGFKWIAQAIDAHGPQNFLYGTEESHGYMAGTHVRDKDGAVAAMLACELAAKLKAEGKTLHEKLDDLFWQQGLHAERTVSVMMPGSDGMDRMKAVMAQFRTNPPEALAGIKVAQRRDYLQNVTTKSDGTTEPLPEPTGDLVILDLAEEGNYVACRPSGTEPKIKFYMFAFIAPEKLHDLDVAKAELDAQLDSMEAGLREFAGV
ncbi:phospho-sugar mutase [Aeoliella mucimassa]|uniref:Phosphoglucomutase n=1 Tax=Aeoliella mucimassa TaxID=2527972 RepID=A0A518ATN8_9BACT|nr:phospho-sugar mutase [Aeoliella mucimassa]QDU58093.1 Phosphoglucomutase [Aeoliella mucimassa]